MGAMGCLCCGAGTEVGTLCRPCAQDVAPCEGLIPDHVRSTVTSTDADAWLVDGFGAAHAAAEKTMIGRSQEGQLVVLASSVSREHAEPSDDTIAVRRALLGTSSARVNIVNET